MKSLCPEIQPSIPQLLLSDFDRLLQYTFSRSTLLVHPGNKKPLDNRQIFKGFLICSPDMGII